MTQKELAAYHRTEAQKSHMLWIGAHTMTAQVLERFNKRQALSRLRQMRKEFRSMAISCIFAGAVNDLARTRR